MVQVYAGISFRPSDNALFATLEPGDGSGIIDISNGDLTELGGTTVACCGNGIAFTPDDTLYHWNESQQSRMNQTTGAMTFDAVATYPAGIYTAADAEYYATTGTVWAVLRSSGPGSANDNYIGTIDVSTGVATSIAQTDRMRLLPSFGYALHL